MSNKINFLRWEGAIYTGQQHTFGKSSSTVSLISVYMPTIATNSNLSGGASISSYALEYNGGSATVFQEFVGDTIEQLSQTINVPTTPGITYQFSNKVNNIFGYLLGYSLISTIKSAKAPNSPSCLITSISGQNVKIDWIASNNNFDSITRYQV